MTGRSRFNKILFTLLCFLMFVSINSYAQNNFTAETVEPPKIVIKFGKSVVIKTEENINRASIGSSEIADFILISPNEIYIKGKAAGITNMILWRKGGVSTIYDIEVDYDLSRLKEKLYQILPDEKEIQIMSTNDSLTLFGRVSSAGSLSQAMALAKSYAPKGKVNNILTVGGTHQVMLEVKIAEMSRSVGRDLGVNLGVLTEMGDTTVEILSSFTSFSLPSATAAFVGSDGDTSWSGLINALKQNGAIKILAEPNLIALSGQTASFLAGGQFPYPVPQKDGTPSVQFKDFGIGLSFTPNVLSQDNINIKVNSSVSELDLANNYAGIPGLSTRRTATTVELSDGQSFVIAGLLSETIRDNVEKFPFLGEIPFLGTLFRSSAFRKNETELVVIVTPRLVKSFDKATQPIPTDYYEEPGDTEFYFGFDMLSKKEVDGGNMDGQFGHSFEKE